MKFKDRSEAGQMLASALKKYEGQDAVVYALPRGGVVIGAQISKKLGLPFDLLIARKIGHPYSPEYAIAAVTETGEIVANEVEVAAVDQTWFEEAVRQQREESQRRRKIYLGKRKPYPVKGKIAIIVDDGLATGLTMKAAIGKLRHEQPKKIIVAVPVAPKETIEELQPLVDEVIAIFVPEVFAGAIGNYYEDFPQVSEEEVVALLSSVNP